MVLVEEKAMVDVDGSLVLIVDVKLLVSVK